MIKNECRILNLVDNQKSENKSCQMREKCETTINELNCLNVAE